MIWTVGNDFEEIDFDVFSVLVACGNAVKVLEDSGPLWFIIHGNFFVLEDMKCKNVDGFSVDLSQ